jgi:hypothetical protein
MNETTASNQKYGFDFSDDVTEGIDLVLTFPLLYKDEQGEPIKFEFALRLIDDGEADDLERESATGDHDHVALARALARALLEAPKGFKDFPEPVAGITNWLPRAAFNYFKEPTKRKIHMVRTVMSRYNRVILPDQMFR